MAQANTRRLRSSLLGLLERSQNDNDNNVLYAIAEPVVFLVCELMYRVESSTVLIKQLQRAKLTRAMPESE